MVKKTMAIGDGVLVKRFALGTALVAAMIFNLPGGAETLSETVSPRIREHLYDVRFISRTDGWAVGAFGTILRTTDGGTKWQRQASGTEERLFGIDFAGRQAGWIVGRAGTILGTRDGVKWGLQKSGTENHLFKVRAVSPEEAWVVGDWGVILRTVDGGATWENRALPEDVILNDIAFVGRGHAWIAGEAGAILVSEDEGRTWTRQESGTDKTLYSIRFVDAQKGWAVGLDGVMLRTTDGGLQWTLERGRGSIESLEEMGFLDVLKNPALYAIDVVGDFGIAVGDLGIVLVSKDGGATWNQQEVPAEWRLRWLRALSLVSGMHGAVVGASGSTIPVVDGVMKYPEL